MTRMLSLRAFFGLAVAACLLGAVGCGYGSKVEHGNVEVFYKDGATKDEANRLGAYLSKTWGGAGDKRSVQLKKKSDGYEFRMVVKKEFQNDPIVLEGLAVDAARVSRDVFDGAPVELHACDDHLETVKVVPPRPDMRYGIVSGQIEVFYSAPAEKADAERMAKFLASLWKNNEVTLTMSRRGEIVEVHMVIKKELQDDPKFLESVRETGKELSANVFDKTPVEMHLCDEHLKVLRVVKP